MPKAVVLLSGGLDSTTVCALACSQGFEVLALTIAYGQRHDAEIAAARRVAEVLKVFEHKVMEVPLDAFGGSALTSGLEVPKSHPDAPIEPGIPVTYVPARNTVLLALALAYAEAERAFDIFIGVNAVDYSGYPDCRPEFTQAFEALARLATKAGVEGGTFRIQTPLMRLTKPEIVRMGLELGIDYSLTHSCYDPGPGCRACGRCDSCRIRRRAFAEIGMSDPALVHLGHA